MMTSKWTASAVVLAIAAVMGIGAAAARAGVVISPSAGYLITWDGNDGDHFDLPVPANLSLTAGTQIQSSFLPAGNHAQPGNVNDGLYGNSESWIGNTIDPNAWVGVKLDGVYDLSGIAWGRDNGNVGEGQFSDRNLGLYTVQVTTSPVPSTTTSWTTIGTLNYASTDDGVVGGAFTGYFRHEYAISATSGPLLATGVRILAPNGNAFDEIELYGAATANPLPQSPIATSGLRSWVKADGEVTTGGGGAITFMADHSYNGNPATIGISPILTPNAINALPAARFDASIDHVNLPTSGPAGLDIANSDYEVFIIAKSATANTNIEFLIGGAVPNYELHLNGSSGARFIPSGAATPSPDTFADLGVVGQFSDGRAHLFSMRVDADTGYLRVVGMENGDTVAGARSAISSIITLGLRTNGFNNFVGDMGEVLVYNRALTADERRQVEQYLARKWKAPLNVASQTQGGIAFANELIAAGGFAAHQIDHLNDANYGNSFSWIGNNTTTTAATAYAGVGFDGHYDINSLAFGRAANGSNGDRWQGVYTFQYTTDEFDPGSLASVDAATWQTFLVVDYFANPPSDPGYLRHLFEFAELHNVTGMRVMLTDNTLAIDELEFYGFATIPTPSGAAMIAALASMTLVRRRRQTA